MDKIWLKEYEESIPHEINPDQYASLIELAEEAFSKFSDKTAFRNWGENLTFKQVDDLSNAIASFFVNHWRLKKGDRVGIMMPNLLQYPVILWGILRAGLVVVNINPLYTPNELKHVLIDSGAKGLVVLANFAHTVQKALPECPEVKVMITEIGDLFSFFKKNMVNFVVKKIKKMVPDFTILHHALFLEAIKLGLEQSYQVFPIRNQDIAFLQYTGGTTGGSKGAMLTHRNMIANILQAKAWVMPSLKQEPKGGIITALPLYHIFSLTANCMVFMNLGICNILITNPKDMSTFIKEMKRQPFMAMTGVNTLFNALVNYPDFAKLDFSNFSLTLGGGMAVQHTVAEKWKKITGHPLIEAYGLTEASPACTINPMNLKDFNSSIGLPLPSTEVSIRDQNGQELPIGESGELWVKGPQVMKGYWNDLAKTAEVLTPDGWLKTGDIGCMDNKGYFRIIDRIKDMIIVSGFNVYPAEIEEIISRLPGVKEVAVVGVAAGSRGEIVKAYVTRNPKIEPPITSEKIIEHCKIYLTHYKIPKEVEFKDDLPKTNVGKILRRALREGTVVTH
jgi:long-chain acyl-CoA synthetase